MATLHEYHFDLGNSNDGPVGLCAVVKAKSEEEALSILRKALPEEASIPAVEMESRIVYINVYTNGQNVTVKDIDDVQDCEEEVDEDDENLDDDDEDLDDEEGQ